jgi:hypothetical protein
MSQGTSQHIATFRDPAGSLSISGEHVLRTVHPHCAAESLRFLQSSLASRWTEQGHLVASEVVSAIRAFSSHPIPGNGRLVNGSRRGN